MSNLKLIALSALAMVMFSCGGGEKKDAAGEETTAAAEESSNNGYDANVGIGEFNASNVDVSKFDAALAATGKGIVDVKCVACHKTTDEKLVGPGWAGITQRKTPAWIMNFITNPDPMIDVDPELQEQLAICMTRMPNQNLSKDDARAILEFMRENDGAK